MERTNNISKNRLFAIRFTSLALLSGFIYFFQFSSVSILISVSWLFWIYKTYYSYYKIEIPTSLREHSQHIFDGFKNLRSNSPGIFCGLLCTNFFIIAILGQLVPGFYALFAILFTIVLVSTQYDIRIIKENDDSTPVTEVEEFYPQLDEKNLIILNQIGENADDSALYTTTISESNSRTNDDSDDDDSLIPKNADLPNIEDELEDSDNENVGLLARHQQHYQRNPNEILTQGIEYKPKHFDESSDSSDSSITSGLDFSNVPHTVVDSHQPQPQNLMSQSTPSPFLTQIQSTVTRNLLDNLMKSASGSLTGAPSSQHKHSSQKTSNKKSSKYQSTSSDEDDSDFEILDKDDL